MAKKKIDPVPDPRTREPNGEARARTTLRLRLDLKAWVEQLAGRHNRTSSAEIHAILDDARARGWGKS